MPETLLHIFLGTTGLFVLISRTEQYFGSGRGFQFAICGLQKQATQRGKRNEAQKPSTAKRIVENANGEARTLNALDDAEAHRHRNHEHP